jgi:AmmeMemoRadiSam system protein A
MGKILGGYLFPHPPIIVKEIGRGEERKAIKTVEGSEALAKDIGQIKPSTIIIITPHGPLFRDAISISMEEELRGDFGNFGRSDLQFDFQNNVKLGSKIVEKSREKSISILEIDKDTSKKYNIDLKIDHGSLVPLYFVNREYKDYKLIHITYGLLSPEELFEFGRLIQDIVLESRETTIMIASGDLSHRLSNMGPYDYSPYGEIFDKKIVELLGKGDFKSIVNFNLELSEAAGECGLRSLMILSGFLDNLNFKSKVLSYEGPFGVGYSNALFKIEESEYVRLARNSLEYYIENGKVIDAPENLSEKLLNERYGAFVTIKIDNNLRGCIGTIAPTRTNLAEEIIYNAIASGTEDPRFRPITKGELSSLEYSVDVLYPSEKISSVEELDVKKYGVIVSKGFRRGLLLPNLEGIDTVDEQLSIALMKAGIDKYEDYEIERFQVERYF